MLDELVDESDPDVDFPNSFHAFQTAEGIRKAHPDKGAQSHSCPDCGGSVVSGGRTGRRRGGPVPSGPSLKQAPSPSWPCPACLHSRLVPSCRTLARLREGSGIGRGAPGEARGRKGSSQVSGKAGKASLTARLGWWAGCHHPHLHCHHHTHGLLLLSSGLLLEIPSQWAAVPRPLWFSVTPPSRTTLTFRTPDTGAPSHFWSLSPPPDTPESPSSYICPCSTELGMYQPHCGLENVLMSWGHDGEAVRGGRGGGCLIGGCPVGA